uniref:Holin n=1 Tax=Haemonchus placei TaxID=6290 RepID=A0A0N4WYT1_HAEPC
LNEDCCRKITRVQAVETRGRSASRNPTTSLPTT